jgi:pimeloyl-ACP methyl ester carboxylesterase
VKKFRPSLWRIGKALVAVYALALVGCASFQRSLLYYPSHNPPGALLQPWRVNGELLGFVLERPAPAAIWLMLHGNAGQATDREYALTSFPEGDTVYVLEYPGYGSRPGSPCKDSFNAAAEEAYRALRKQYPAKPICVLGESIGSGPACHLCTLSQPPEKLVLVVPFEQLVKVAADAMPFLPVRLMFFDRWNNAEALRAYRGPIEIFGAADDEVIPIKHATALAQGLPHAQFHLISGHHNEWSHGDKVRFTGPASNQTQP